MSRQTQYYLMDYSFEPAVVLILFHMEEMFLTSFSCSP